MFSSNCKCENEITHFKCIITSPLFYGSKGKRMCQWFLVFSVCCSHLASDSQRFFSFIWRLINMQKEHFTCIQPICKPKVSNWVSIIISITIRMVEIIIKVDHYTRNIFRRLQSFVCFLFCFKPKKNRFYYCRCFCVKFLPIYWNSHLKFSLIPRIHFEIN